MGVIDDRASVLYAGARNRGQWGQVWSALTGRSRCLFALNEVASACTGGAHRNTGEERVSINRIRGSEGRSGDFDRNFNPLQDHTKDRWLRVAVARQQGKALPPVELVKIGDVYFVRDGHHRVSVARTLGHRDVEAQVTVYQVSGPLPWEEPAAAPSIAGQETGLKRLIKKDWQPIHGASYALSFVRWTTKPVAPLWFSIVSSWSTVLVICVSMFHSIGITTI